MIASKNNNLEKPLITIVGVLGKQGQSAARTLLESGRYRVRGITRRLDSQVAQELIDLGAELISIPLNSGHQQDFQKAFRGSYGVFMMTPNISPPQTHEFELGKELADAAVFAGVQHLIFSSLENVDKLTNGKMFAPHFTDKAEIEEYIRTLPITSSFIYMAFFYTNLMEFYTPRFDGDKLIFPIYLPRDFKAPFVDPLTATGPAVLEIFSDPIKYADQALPVIGDFISPQEMIDTFVKVTGKKAVYSSAYTKSEFLHHFPSMETNDTLVNEIVGMASFAVEHGYFNKDRDWQWSRKVNRNSLSWEAFLLKTNWKGEQILF